METYFMVSSGVFLSFVASWIAFTFGVRRGWEAGYHYAAEHIHGDKDAEAETDA